MPFCTPRNFSSASRASNRCTPRSRLSSSREDRGCTPRSRFSACREGRVCTLHSRFSAAVGAGGANRAAAFQPAVGAAGARGAAMFQLTVRAGAAHSTLALLPPMRASLHSHGSRATKPRALASARPGKSWSEVVVVAFEEIFFVSSQAIFLSSFFLPKRLASPPLFSSRRVRLRTRRARPRTLPCD